MPQHEAIVREAKEIWEKKGVRHVVYRWERDPSLRSG